MISIEKTDFASGITSDWIIYNEKVPSLDGPEELRTCAVVSPVNIAMFAGDYSAELMHETLGKSIIKPCICLSIAASCG